MRLQDMKKFKELSYRYIRRIYERIPLGEFDQGAFEKKDTRNGCIERVGSVKYSMLNSLCRKGDSDQKAQSGL